MASATLRRKTGSVLLIDGHRVNARRDTKQGALLACLFADLGYVIPYKRLCSAIGRKSASWSDRHLLRQHVSFLRDRLLAHKAPYVIAVVPEVGYGLCEIAESPRRASTSRKSVADLPELGRNLRRLRTAAGLTQIALAKRSGVNRAYVSRLERGRQNPPAVKLGRLARILRVSLASFFDEQPDSTIDLQER
jgi:DNA-binding XRE family transcriptional regulator